MSETCKTTSEIWNDDRLGFAETGKSFTKLIQSIDDTKVLSIEAGYGRGKTFFRERWAAHLKAEGEVVVEIDAHLSDHSGDPAITFLGAMIENLPDSATSTGKELLKKARKYGGVLGRVVLRAGLRQGAEELLDATTDKAVDALGEKNAGWQEATQEFGNDLSKAAGDLIVSQIALERARRDEFPEQLAALRDALTKDHKNKRVVVLVDELDRCHPDYAIAFLEAMKMVFSHEGFVFCLMVNAEYLEGLAAHRFGQLQRGERYLDKFIDIRLRLPDTRGVLAAAVADLARELPLRIAFGDKQNFGVEPAAVLAGKMAVKSGLSMRQIKRVLLKVELALRCYADEPLDCPLLVFLAFQQAEGSRFPTGPYVAEKHLPRARLTEQEGAVMLRADDVGRQDRQSIETIRSYQKDSPELFRLPDERYDLPNDRVYKDWYRVGKGLAPYYLSRHQNILDAVHNYEVPTAD